MAAATPPLEAASRQLLPADAIAASTEALIRH